MTRHQGLGRGDSEEVRVDGQRVSGFERGEESVVGRRRKTGRGRETNEGEAGLGRRILVRYKISGLGHVLGTREFSQFKFCGYISFLVFRIDQP